MNTPKLWTKLVDDAVHRHMSRWRLGEIAAVVREAATAWATQVEALDAELMKYVDISIFLERDRDQCARERDAYKAEAAALRARLDALTAALRPALEAEQGATRGPWEAVQSRTGDYSVCGGNGVVVSTLTWSAKDAAYIAAAANAVRAAGRAGGGGEVMNEINRLFGFPC